MTTTIKNINDLSQLFRQLFAYESIKYQEFSIEERLLLLKAIQIRLGKISEAVKIKIVEYEQVLSEKGEQNV